jgi:hypothetical protein
MWTWAFRLSQAQKQGSRCRVLCAGGEQPEPTHRVSVTVWHVSGQRVYEVFNQVAGCHYLPFLQILRQKLNLSIRDLGESMLGDGRSSNVPRYIS